MGDRTAVRAGQDSEVVLMLDEAQVRDADHEGVLRALHTVGLEDLHTVLSHTGTNLRKFGWSVPALGDPPRCIWAFWAKNECIESTRLMLARCEIGGSGAQHAATAQEVGAMAQRWPQHLACAHAALARELLRVDRDLGGVDMDAVNRKTAEARSAYSWARLQGHPLLENARFTARVVGAVHRQNANASKSHRRVDPVLRLGQVVRLCRQIWEAEPAGSCAGVRRSPRRNRAANDREGHPQPACGRTVPRRHPIDGDLARKTPTGERPGPRLPDRYPGLEAKRKSRFMC